MIIEACVRSNMKSLGMDDTRAAEFLETPQRRFRQMIRGEVPLELFQKKADKLSHLSGIHVAELCELYARVQRMKRTRKYIVRPQVRQLAPRNFTRRLSSGQIERMISSEAQKGLSDEHEEIFEEALNKLDVRVAGFIRLVADKESDRAIAKGLGLPVKEVREWKPRLESYLRDALSGRF